MGRNYSDDAIAQLNFGRGQVLRGDAFLILTKAMLQSGVGYLGGYPGAPVSGLYDVMEDAYHPVLESLGVVVNASANEASAAAMLAASVNNPIRGAINMKVVGTNVAADGLAHLSASGVKGGVMVVVGEDYGMDSTAVAERSLPYAFKSGLVCIDPVGDPATLALMVEEGFNISEYSHAPVLYMLRTRTGNLTGSLTCKDNRAPVISPRHPVEAMASDINFFPLPPYAFEQERLKFTERLDRAREYILKERLNRLVPGRKPVGIITHGLIYNTTCRALHLLGEAELSGNGTCAILALNVIHPLAPDEIAGFLRDKEQVLVVEEGSPNLLEEQVRAIAQQEGLSTRIYGKDILPHYGEYTPQVLVPGLGRFLAEKVYSVPEEEEALGRVKKRSVAMAGHLKKATSVAAPLPIRSPQFCAGCPERPVFSMLKLVERDRGRPYYAADSGCYAMGSLPPFYCDDSYTGMGMGLAAAAVASRVSQQPVVAFMGDGTFWHSGMATSVANAVYNRQDAVLVIFENGYTAMTGQQENPSSGVNLRGEEISSDIVKTLHSMGVKHVEVVDPYDVKSTLRAYKKAVESSEEGPRVLVARGECALERGRQQRAEDHKRLSKGKPVAWERLGVDVALCREDRSCVRPNGCPALTLDTNPSPVREDPVTTITAACTGCRLCGEMSHALALCPSFYGVKVTTNPRPWTRLWHGLNHALIHGLFRVEV
ncbi:MAG: indolepyruvate ferredoxin oxidoreductase subunit alpha [Dehalococcoidia bacterium]|nr:indolepyruvate ferredoxin oxidoreductase subunit alpha [Dehalococcoidia bacterium]